MMIGVTRDWLDVPESEKRILSTVKRQRKFDFMLCTETKKYIGLIKIDSNTLFI